MSTWDSTPYRADGGADEVVVEVTETLVQDESTGEVLDVVDTVVTDLGTGEVVEVVEIDAYVPGEDEVEDEHDDEVEAALDAELDAEIDAEIEGIDDGSDAVGPGAAREQQPSGTLAFAVSAKEQLASLAEPEVTGDPRIDAATARLGDLADLPTSDHVAVYDDVHRRLQDALADAEVR